MESMGKNDYLEELRIWKLNTYSWVCCSFIYDLGQIISQLFFFFLPGHLVFIPLAIKHTGAHVLASYC